MDCAGSAMRFSIALGAVLLFGPGCQSALGKYFANRARDFGECWRAEVRFAAGIGVDVQAAGLLHVGVGGYFAPGVRLFGDEWGLGWIYGHPIVSAARPGLAGAAYLPATLIPHALGGPHSPGPFSRGWHFAGEELGPPNVWRRHSCYGLLPGLISNVATSEAAERFGPDWAQRTDLPECWEAWWGYRLWTAEALRLDPWSHVHAFDCELGLSALFFEARLGFSPGEFVDFVLGWVGADIAGDDTPWIPPGER
jgi:hypothetical protein